MTQIIFGTSLKCNTQLIECQYHVSSTFPQDVIKVCVLLAICMIGFSVSMWTVTLQSYTYEGSRDDRNAATDGELSYPELFSSFNTTLVTLLWSTFGLIEPDNIKISYNDNADTYLKVRFLSSVLSHYKN